MVRVIRGSVASWHERPVHPFMHLRQAAHNCQHSEGDQCHTRESQPSRPVPRRKTLPERRHEP
jgi:hypothetical protein